MRIQKKFSLLSRIALSLGLAAGLLTAASPAMAKTEKAEPAKVRVAVAANMKFAMEELMNAYHRSHPNVRVIASYGSSGKLAAQITNEAPFDLFLAADNAMPQKVAKAGRAEANDIFNYAQGRLVLWTLNSTKLDAAKRGMDALKDPSVKKIAIANPAHAPYGQAAMEVLKKYGLDAQVKNNLVTGEDISQTTQFVESGAAEIGFVALSLAMGPTLKTKGNYFEIPQDAYQPLQQSAVVLKGAENPEATRAFSAWLQTAPAHKILKSFGFGVPVTAKTAEAH